jgi:hypothetical protein
MKIGDRLNFKKFYWEITSSKKTIYGMKEYKYKVVRKYFKGLLKLKHSNKTYTIWKERWLFLEKKLKENPDYHYSMSLWSNYSRLSLTSKVKK